MSQRTPGRGDWLFVTIVLIAFVCVFWALFGAFLWRAIEGHYP